MDTKLWAALPHVGPRGPHGSREATDRAQPTLAGLRLHYPGLHGDIIAWSRAWDLKNTRGTPSQGFLFSVFSQS